MTIKRGSLYDILIKLGLPEKLAWSKFISMRIENYLSSSFPIANFLKQGDALSLLLFNFSKLFAIWKVLETILWLDLKGTHQVLAYTDNVTLLDDIITIEINADVLLNAYKHICLPVNIRKT